MDNPIRIVDFEMTMSGSYRKPSNVSDKTERSSMTSDPAEEENQYFTIRELAVKFRMGESTFRRYVNKLKIPKIKMGHQIVRLHKPTVEKFLYQKTKK